MKFIVIGISDSRNQRFSPEVLQAIQAGKVFTGGVRHHEIVADILPPDAQWIYISAPLTDVFAEYRIHGNEVVVFASGDPLFYGIATTLMREFPDAEIQVMPSFNSIQLLAHKCLIPYHDLITVSLTGRPWKNLDDALIEGYPLIGVLTDRLKTPSLIAQRMIDYGYDNYEIFVGQMLGNEESESVGHFSLYQAAGKRFHSPNCVILRQTSPRQRFFGIPEERFTHLRGRSNMITKMPVRLLSLAMLDLPNKTSLWDIGFCTGSISIEARLAFPHLHITAFEKRPQAAEIINENCRKFGAPGIKAISGDFFDLNLESFYEPDAVFIGGHGGRLPEMISRICEFKLPDTTLVFNSVSQQSCDTFIEAIHQNGMQIVTRHHLALDSFNPITILKAQ